MKIAFLASEVVPWSKTGGLADVSGALPASLRESGHEVVTVTPRFGTTPTDDLVIRDDLTLSGPALAGQIQEPVIWEHVDSSTFFIDLPEFFDRGVLYTNDPDEHRRWVAFQHLALRLLLSLRFRPKVVHCNDWQTGLVPLLMKTEYPEFVDVPSLLSIHNLGYQGRFGADTVRELGLGDPGLLHQDHLREGWYSFLETGLLHADWIATVSPTYASEIQTPEGGAGMDGILRQRSDRVVGILNGIDTDEWNPRTDQLIPWRYSAGSLWRKERDKQELLAELGLEYRDKVPVLGIISRFANQKGFDIMGGPLVHFLDTWDVRVVVLGSGESQYESYFHWLATMNPGRVGFRNGYDNGLAHRIEAGADLFLMPSLYEPCGLNQMYSLRYGTIPVVRRVGGLADTVEPIEGDSGTGIVFDHYSEDALGWAIGRGLELHMEPKAWKAAQQRGMEVDNSWAARADEYVDLYRRMRP